MSVCGSTLPTCAISAFRSTSRSLRGRSAACSRLAGRTDGTRMVWLVFWLSLAALAYGYAGYSLVLGLVGLLRNRRVRPRPCTPPVSLIIAAHNEARAIARPLEDALSLEYLPHAPE